MSQLHLVAIPVIEGDGKCYEFSVSRPDLKHLTAADLDAVRAAFGQQPFDSAERFHVPDWQPAS